MKILQINASYKPAYIYGGPTMSVSKLSEELVKAGCTVEVFTTTANGLTELQVTTVLPQDIDGVKVRYFKRLTKDHSHFSPGLLAFLWKEVQSFDVVHVHAWWNLVSIFACFIAILRRVPIVLSPRGTLSNYSFKNRHIALKKVFHALIGRPLLSYCFLHTTSEREQAAMATLLKPKGIYTLYNFVKMPKIAHFPTTTPLNPQENGIFRLLFFSRIEQKKGLELLFAALADTTLPFRLTIAGSGDEKYIAVLKKLINDYKIDHRVDWVGFKDDDKFELMAAHHLLILPSYDENFGNVVIESLAVGTAVLISREVGLATYITSRQFGWVCNANVLSIKNSLTEIYNNPEKLNAIRTLAPPGIRDDFEETILIKKYDEMYKHIIATLD
ncbi:Glycosyl transferase group 1 [Pedobacter cryoconitis]|uniref:Glycosyl transferase group 1 n=1 Tax=Pedobacter cryoconitis TaxID=188932 RepID=A0A127VJ65_9SPHI|nr:glycosyltransferase [Pedobacter cryoconitis]AMQ01241.1 Glycosyl transferase group 1 [Pedobacter cryoconitis]